MAIKSKKTATIKQGTNYSYNKDTFIKEHKMPNSFETNKAEDVLKLMKPFTFMGRKFIVLDTEDYPLPRKNNTMPKYIVRRWVGTGKKATPVDVPFCMSFCDGVNMITLYDTWENNYAEFAKLAPLLEDPEVEMIFHNTKFDMHQWANIFAIIGIKLIGKLHDTVVLAKLVNENRFSFQLRDIAGKLPNGIDKFEYMVDGYKKENKITDYRMIPRALLTEYANADVWNAYQLFITEYPMLIEDELEPLYNNEMELMIVLWAMERRGMRVDPELEDPLKKELQELTDNAEKAVYDAVGYVFNMNSNKQIHEALMHMGVDPSIFRFTEKGNVKLDKKEKERLISLGVELVVKIAEYHKADKLLNTYAIGIYDQLSAEERVHGSINQTEATTGRMSITKPALQTLPKKDKRIRSMFIPSDDYVLWFWDLDQVEYRGLAHYAKCTGLIEAIKNGHDIHAGTAALVYDKDIKDIDPDGQERDSAKTINFSLVYGQGDDATAASLKVSKSQAIRFKHKYFSALPEVEPFLDTVKRVTKSRGYIRNFYGRRRRLKPQEVYKAPNALIQSWAADYIKHKIVLMHKYLIAINARSYLINIVHDEIIGELHVSEQHLAAKLRWIMSEWDAFRVPITAGAECSHNSWGAKESADNIGFEPLTEEEWEAVNAVNLFDGSVFEIGQPGYEEVL